MRRLFILAAIGLFALTPAPAAASNIAPEQRLTKRIGATVRYPREVRVAHKVARLVGTVVIDWRYVGPKTLWAQVPEGWIRLRFPRRGYPVFEIVF